MKKTLYLLLLNFIIILNAQSQISFGGKPYSFSKSESLNDSIPVKIMPSINIGQLLKEDSIESGKLIPWRFGKDIDVNYNLENSGIWQALQNGDRLWRIEVKSKGALSLNFIFNKFRLPAGATFFIYNKEHTKVLGAFNEQNNRDDGVFATTIIKGESAIFEYYEPANVKGKGFIQLSKLIHGYKDIVKVSKGGFEQSGSCNININCPEGLPWYNEKRSVAMILQSNNTRICTGALVNNVKLDGVPYFLTANHCTEGESINTWIFMFNYESPDCTNEDGNINQTLLGADLKATDIPSDFSLIELRDIPPITYNVYYSGWSAVDQPSDSCVTIHHPTGDIKKISLEYETVISTAWETDYADSHWAVPHWDKGTTEKGSSGAPLYNKNHKIIGQLHGGTASCSSLSDDNFGKFSYSWNKGSTPETRLQNWLDPENTGTKTVNGNDFNHPTFNLDAALINIISPDTGSICQKSAIPSIVLQNFGLNDLTSVDIYYKVDNKNPVKYSWTGKLSYMNFKKIDLSSVNFSLGKHTFIVYSDNPNNSIDENHINDTLKVNFTAISGNQVIVNLKTDNFADETSWNIKDTNNNIIINNPSLLSNTISYTKACLNSGCYIFTIHDNYGDGICEGVNVNDTGYVQITYNDTILGYINGCEFDSTASINFCVGNHKIIPVVETFNIYPSLNDGAFTINYITANNQKAECIVYSVIGEMITGFPLENNHKTPVDLKWLRSGIYFLSLNETSRKRVRKIIIVRNKN